MSEELNDDLKRRISEVFDNYEDPTADEGWALLREKFPQEAKVVPMGTRWQWWASAAAAILLFVGVGVWMSTNQVENNTQTIAKQHNKVNKQEAVDQPKEVPAVEAPVTSRQNNAADVLSSDYAATLIQKVKPVTIPAQQPSIQAARAAKTDVTAPVIVEQPTPAPAQSIAANTPQQPVNNPINTNTVQPPVTNNQLPVQPTPAQTMAAVQKPAQTPAQVKKPNGQEAITNDAFLAMLEKENKGKTEATNNREDKAKSKVVNFGVYAGTYVNYAKGSDNNVNVGAGFQSDFRISKNLKLSTGVAIAQNSFKYGGTQLPQAAAEASLVAKAVADNKGFGPSNLPPSIQNYNASLVGLDIPMNIKYEFNPAKSDTYISAGVSSGTFISENYTYRYNYTAPFSTSQNAQSQIIDEKINEQFNNFYIAKTLNLSFGMGYPIGRSNRLVIEPFVKYPLAGLGAQQIKFGAGGVNLKLNFSTGRRR